MAPDTSGDPLPSLAGRGSSWAQRRLKQRKQPLVLCARADGDAQPFREAVAFHRTRDHARALQAIEDRGAVAHLHENEIPLSRYELQPKPLEARLQLLKAGA